MDDTVTVKKISVVLFIIYLLALVWIVVLGMQLPLQTLEGDRIADIIPFKSVYERLGYIDYKNIFISILLFIPMGVYMSMMRPAAYVAGRIWPIIVISFGLELAKLVFNLGTFDTTRICMNVAGAVLGIILEYILFHIFGRNSYRILLIAMAVFTVIIVMTVGMGLAS